MGGTGTKVRIAILNSSGVANSAIETSQLNDAAGWVHYMGVINGTNVSLYKNGVLDASNARNIGDISYTTGAKIGVASHSVTNWEWDGSIDEVVLWNRSLTADEVLGLYNATRVFHTETGLTEGNHEFKGYTSDLSGNIGTSEDDFFVDTVLPVVTFVSPTPNDDSSQSATAIAVNVSVTEANDYYSFVNFDNDTLLWMRFDDVNGSGDPLDSSDYGNTGDAVANAVQVDNGKFGEGFAFDGAGDWVSAFSSDIPINNSDFTLSFWGKSVSDTGDNQYAMGSYTAGGDFRFGRFSAGNLYFYSANATISVFAGVQSDWDEWHHYVATLNSTTATVYKDGAVIGTPDASVGVLDVAPSAATTRIGDRLNDQWNGTIDEVMVFSR
ncbi:MAG: sialidase domain-containing protein, partial [Anaerolineales bacterium]|nr:sialidase domain-containing protein [Anaerolineales bacterium]